MAEILCGVRCPFSLYAKFYLNWLSRTFQNVISELQSIGLFDGLNHFYSYGHVYILMMMDEVKF